MAIEPSAAQNHGSRLSVVVITRNEESNIGRTLESVQSLVREGQGEIIVVDSGSTDRTVEIARSYGAMVYIREWRGFADQKNWGLGQATGDWLLSLDADESVEPELADEIRDVLCADPPENGFWVKRKNYFLGRWIRHGGHYPDPKLRLFRRGKGEFEKRLVHETVQVSGPTRKLAHDLLHHAYPTLAVYIEHMDRYSSLGAEMVVAKGYCGFSVFDIAIRPWATFFYNYFLRLGFLDGREGLLLHLYHAVYVSWKYAKVWELGKRQG